MTTGYLSYILGTSKENQIKRSQTKQMQAKVVINRHQVKANKSAKDNQPCISIRTYKGVTYARKVKFTGEAILVQDFGNPLCSGANVWIETDFHNIEILED